MRSSSKLENRVLVLGAGGAIGTKVVSHLSSLNYELIVHSGTNKIDKNSDKNIIESFVSDARNSKEFVESVSSQDFYHCIDCIGPWKRSNLDEVSPRDWQEIIDLNLTVKGMLITKLIEKYKSQKGGTITLFGSSHSESVGAYKTIIPFAAAKTGLAVLVKSVAKEYQSDNIRCNMINPGVISLGNESFFPSDPQWMQAFMNNQSRPKIEFLVEFLMRSDNFYINGAIINAGNGV